MVYPFCVERLLSKPTLPAMQSYLGIGSGGAAISAGTESQNTGTIIFSNSNSVSFGLNAGTLTASINAPASPVNFSAGTTSNNLASVVLSNSNGVSFGLNGSTITASHDGLTSQSNQAASASNGSFTFQTLGFSNANNVTFGTSAGSIITASVVPAGAASVNFSAGTTSGNLDSVVFSNSNGVSFGLNGSTITASVAPAGAASLNVSAGTTSNNLTDLVFSNSNGVSFGLDGSTITASHNGLTSQSNQAFSASGGSSTFQTLSFNNANGLTFSNNGGAVEASYTVPSTAGLISAINVSASTTSNNLTAITFANSNGITFGLNASTITASHDGLTSQSNQAASASNGSFTFQTLGFSNANNVTFGTSAGSIVTASVNAGGAAATISAFDQYLVSTSAAAWNNATFSNRPIFMPFILPAAISAVNTINIVVSRSGGTSALASLHAGIYTIANATSMNLLASTSFAVSLTTSSLFSSLRSLAFTGLGTLSLSPGHYVMGLEASFAAINSWGMFAMGIGSMPNIVGIIHAGTNSTAATSSNSHFMPFWGVFNDTSSALPSAVAASSISGGGNVNSPKIYFAIKAIEG